MPERAHNSGFPLEISFQGQSFVGPVALFESASPPPEVGLATFMSRIRRIHLATGLNDRTIGDALYLPPEVFRPKYGRRRTWLILEGKRVDLQSFYEAQTPLPAVSYRTFWSRIRNCGQKGPIEKELVEHAITLPEAQWISSYGGGRHRPFVYDGDLYPEHRDRSFHGVSAFLRAIGRYEERSTIWSRLKANWDLDTALSIPVDVATERQGLIYRISRIRTGEVYVGLTLGSLDQRWAFHVRFALNGGRSLFAQAIQEDGPEGFSREVLEAGIDDTGTLRKRERFWVEKLGVLGPLGLNTAKPGTLGSHRGVPTEVDGVVYSSRTEATHVLAAKSGLARHVVERRLKSGLPLPSRARKASKHPEAGSNLFRRWLALRRRHHGAVTPDWAESYDAFKADVESGYDSDLELVRIDSSLPWGPKNFEWLPTQKKVERLCGRRLTVGETEYPSLKAVAEAFGIGLSTLKDRLFRQEMSPDEAVGAQLGATSYRSSGCGFTVEGELFRSKRQAILFLIETKGLSEHRAKEFIRSL
jgi:hypothetical protein